MRREMKRCSAGRNNDSPMPWPLCKNSRHARAYGPGDSLPAEQGCRHAGVDLLELRVAVATLAALAAAQDALATSGRIALPPSSADSALATLLRQALATRESLAEKQAPAGWRQLACPVVLPHEGILPAGGCRLSSLLINFMVKGCGHGVEGCGGGQRSRAAARYRP